MDMRQKRHKSLKTVFLKVTKLCNISENNSKKLKVVSQNIKIYPKCLKVQKVPSRQFFKESHQLTHNDRVLI